MIACDMGVPRAYLDSGVKSSLAHRAYWTLRRKCNVLRVTVKIASPLSVVVGSWLSRFVLPFAAFRRKAEFVAV